MKNLLIFAFTVGFASAALADIQDPPSNDHGPTRKLGRGISNAAFGWSEIPHTIAQVNEREGNSAAAGYGVVRGAGRAFMRFGTGLFDIVTFPFPAVRGTYYPPLPDDTRYIHAEFQEFPPELGNESKYEYVRHY